ncbi:MAG: hypothetical protein Q7K37_12550 [Dehalococcoidia bacterium]|nr:hypothetical protein [Dehalococcoidia bacterium]
MRAEASDTGPVLQRSLSSVEQFKQATNAGFLATRDDLLKQIDAGLASAQNWRVPDMDELWLVSGEEIPARAQANIKDRRERYRQALVGLQGLLQTWLTTSRDDASGTAAHRRGPIADLLSEVKEEIQKKPEERVAEIVERKEAAVRAEQALFTADQFKDAANIGAFQSRFGPLGDVMAALNAYHAMPEGPGADPTARLEALQAVRDATSDALQPLNALRRRPGYEKAHMGFEIAQHERLREALGKLGTQIRHERKRLTTPDTTERKPARPGGDGPATHAEGDWEVID